MIAIKKLFVTIIKKRRFVIIDEVFFYFFFYFSVDEANQAYKISWLFAIPGKQQDF